MRLDCLKKPILRLFRHGSSLAVSIPPMIFTARGGCSAQAGLHQSRLQQSARAKIWSHSLKFVGVGGILFLVLHDSSTGVSLLLSEESRSKGVKRCDANLQRMDILLLSRSFLASQKKNRRLKLISFIRGANLYRPRGLGPLSLSAQTPGMARPASN
jgi:hypothetical protein